SIPRAKRLCVRVSLTRLCRLLTWKDEGHMSEKAEIRLPDGSKLECPIVVGTENERAIDIGQLRAKTGLVTIDPAFVNTAACKSRTTSRAGERGPLLPRATPCEPPANHPPFVGVPSPLPCAPRGPPARPENSSTPPPRHSLIHEDMKH